ncbi:hypothetical protein [Xenorhabdus thuongxuanensis]|uniref:Uncharacterized protein n=1 Tax=Xenorhabdus thuongxuanensis TaxID=1873484 RepID=A0A1Q5TRH4_9GAMM|nr:hypothetical protein [Xenorhabdus thuongxuanensis]OKP02822.1 hypothetical protein Xentx_03098 [Xenorhabdus thuongxuanensis]
MKSIDLEESLKNNSLNLTDFLIFRHIREGRGKNIAIHMMEKISLTKNYQKKFQKHQTILSQ